MADRELVGKDWIAFLNDHNIKYHIRIRNNFKVFIPHKNKGVRASRLFNSMGLNEFSYYPKIIGINGQLCYISGCRLKGDYLIIVSFKKPEDAKEDYKERWQIEMCFKAMKSGGFDIEKTHLHHMDRIEKLVLLVMIAFVWCYKVGIYLHKVKPIEIKTHGRNAKSIFKYGLNFIAGLLLNPQKKTILKPLNFCHVLRRLRPQFG